MVDPYDDTPNVITEIEALKALGHPVRLALLDVLLDGPLTATEAGERIGESAASCSFHLRQLERFGFVVIDSVGPGRRRTWRRLRPNWSIPVQATNDAFASTLQQVQSVMLDRYFAQIREAIAVMPSEPAEWQEAMLATQSLFFITSAELAEYAQAFSEFNAAFAKKWGARAMDAAARPAGARRVELLMFGVPIDGDRMRLASPAVVEKDEGPLHKTNEDKA